MNWQFEFKMELPLKINDHLPLYMMYIVALDPTTIRQRDIWVVPGAFHWFLVQQIPGDIVQLESLQDRSGIWVVLSNRLVGHRDRDTERCLKKD